MLRRGYSLTDDVDELSRPGDVLFCFAMKAARARRSSRSTDSLAGMFCDALDEYVQHIGSACFPACRRAWAGTGGETLLAA